MKHKPFCLEDCLGYGGCKCAGYNKEEVMKEFENRFIKNLKFPDYGGLAAIIIEKGSSQIEDFLSTALDAAFQAGRESMKKDIKERIEISKDDISYLDSNDNNECIHIFSSNLRALK